MKKTFKQRLASTIATTRREFRYTRKYAFSVDFRLALLFGVGAFAAMHFAKRVNGTPHLLDVAAGLGVAILAVVMGAISIFAVFLTDDFGTVLRYYFKEDIREAFFPYRLVAAVSCITTFVASSGLFVWSAANHWERELVVALSLGLATWAVLGTFDLVRITAGYGILKLRTPELGKERIAEFEEALRELKP
jgi:hypothetical protein